MKNKNIKFTSIEFNEIGIDGLVNHKYKWDDNAKTLTHLINDLNNEVFEGDNAIVKIKTLIYKEPKKKRDGATPKISQTGNLNDEKQLELWKNVE